MAQGDALSRLAAKFKEASMPLKLVVVNVVIFTILRIAAIFGIFSGSEALVSTLFDYLQLPSRLPLLISRPWTIITYMFSQYDLLHLIFNMLWLYWFGMLLSTVTSGRQLLSLYLLGGLGGALCFLAAYNILPLFANHTGMLIGSSASVMAIVTATAIIMPDFMMNLIFIGHVRLKWIAIVTIVIVILGVTGSNAGGEIAHIGGILTGVLFGMNFKRGRDLTSPLCRLFDALRSINVRKTPKAHATSSPRPDRNPATADNTYDRASLDSILEKIKKSGYAGLTPEERKRLFDISRNIK